MKADENIAGGFELEGGFSDGLACNCKNLDIGLNLDIGFGLR